MPRVKLSAWGMPCCSSTDLGKWASTLYWLEGLFYIPLCASDLREQGNLFLCPFLLLVSMLILGLGLPEIYPVCLFTLLLPYSHCVVIMFLNMNHCPPPSKNTDNLALLFFFLFKWLQHFIREMHFLKEWKNRISKKLKHLHEMKTILQ